jgi:hypothetical protein
VAASRPSSHAVGRTDTFASVDAGLRGYKARHNLAVVYCRQGRFAWAEAQWREVVRERPDFLPGWLGLGEASLRQGKWHALEETAGKLEELPGGASEAAVLRAHGLLARDATGTDRVRRDEVRATSC